MKNQHRAAVGVVGWISDELIIQLQRRLLIKTDRVVRILILMFWALEILKRSANIQIFGGTATRPTLVTSEIVADTDLVISIGKPVQYALVSRTPVYVYDHFGGPVYLDPENIERAYRFSFTGRCCERRLSAERLAQEILDQYSKGVAFARTSTDRCLAAFRLESYLKDAATLPARPNAEKRRALKREPMLPQERMMAKHTRESYLADEQYAKTHS